MKKIIICLVVMIGLIAASCESNTYEEISVKMENPTYVANVKPIITENCISCHASGSGQTPYLETYDEIKDAIVNGNLIQKIEAPSGQGMPISERMSQANIDIINGWVNGGFVNQ